VPPWFKWTGIAQCSAGAVPVRVLEVPDEIVAMNVTGAHHLYNGHSQLAPFTIRKHRLLASMAKTMKVVSTVLLT